MRLGDTFHNTPPGHQTSHLYVILSDPSANPDRIAVASLTTWTSSKDASCMIHEGEHPFARHPTCVYYARATEVTAITLEKAANAGKIVWSAPVAPALLKRIQEGAISCRFTPNKIKQLLRCQGLV